MTSEVVATDLFLMGYSVIENSFEIVTLLLKSVATIEKSNKLNLLNPLLREWWRLNGSLPKNSEVPNKDEKTRVSGGTICYNIQNPYNTQNPYIETIHR